MERDRELEVASGHAQAQRGRWSTATAGLVVGTIVLLGVVPACSSPSRPAAVSATTSTTAPQSVTFEQGSAAEVADCQADAESVETALEAYMAGKAAYPTPPAPWSAGTYAADYGPLTSGAGGEAFLHTPPSDKYNVIEYDSSGHVWVAPPGSFSPTYNVGQDFGANADICDAAVG